MIAMILCLAVSVLCQARDITLGVSSPSGIPRQIILDGPRGAITAPPAILCSDKYTQFMVSAERDKVGLEKGDGSDLVIATNAMIAI